MYLLKHLTSIASLQGPAELEDEDLNLSLNAS